MNKYIWLFALIMLATTVAAESSSVGKGEFGLKFGQLRGTTMEYFLKSNDSRVDSLEIDAGFTGGAYLDQPLFNQLHITISWDIYQIGRYQSSRAALDFAAGMKFKWTEPEGRLSIRPSATVGYAILPNFWRFGSSNYITFKIGLEVASYTKNGTGLLFEISSLKTLSGSDKDYEISIEPMLILRGGLIL